MWRLFVKYFLHSLYALIIVLSGLLYINADVHAANEDGPNLCLENDIMLGQRTIMSLDNLILSNVVHNQGVFDISFSDYFFDMNRK